GAEAANFIEPSRGRVLNVVDDPAVVAGAFFELQVTRCFWCCHLVDPRLFSTNLNAEAQSTQTAADKSHSTHPSPGIFIRATRKGFAFFLRSLALGSRSNVLVLLPRIRIPVIQRSSRRHALELTGVVR